MDNELKLMLQSVIQEALEPLHQRFDRVETKIDTVEQRLDRVETKIDTVEQRLDRVETKVDQVEQSVIDTRGQMNSRFDMLETKLSHVEATVGKVESENPKDVLGMLRQINSKMDATLDLASRVTELETDMKIVKKIISAP